jgi:hypothetical protein
MTVEAGGKPLESGFGKRGVWPLAVAAQNIAMDMQTATRRSIGILRGISRGRQRRGRQERRRR